MTLSAFVLSFLLLENGPPAVNDVNSSVEAQKLFEAMERKLAGAKGYRVDFESKVLTSLSQGRVQGSLRLAPGNRMKLSWRFHTLADIQVKPEGKFTVISDGKTLVTLNDADPKARKSEPSNDRHQDTLSGWGFRIGLFFTCMSRLNRGGDEDYRTLKLSNFQMAGKEMIADRPANVIEFRLTKGTVPTRHKLWLDAQTGLPLKLDVKTRDDLGAIETYRNWQLDPMLPEETFALPK